MEQYIHTLISADSEFAPESAQVASFFDLLVSQFKFSPISGQRWLPGLVVRKPSEKVRWGTDPMTGEKISVPAQDRLNLERFEDIPASIEGSAHYTVAQSGQWAGEERPVDLLGTDGVPYEGSYICTVSCELRPEAVSTSAWDVEAGPLTRNVPAFGSVCTNAVRTGIFPNPWSGEVIEVANAGCARFWIEFEFGKFMYPKVTDSFQVLSPLILSGAEQCFRTKFAQGCRFW
ncbi:MAG: hypothetical protein ACRD25_07740 [Terracidiphilus sp.]